MSSNADGPIPCVPAFTRPAQLLHGAGVAPPREIGFRIPRPALRERNSECARAVGSGVRTGPDTHLGMPV